MKGKNFYSDNKLYTPASQTTIYIDYSLEKQILEVAFTGGETYHYFNVEPQIWEEYKNVILSTGSSGTFVNTTIKPKYRYERISY